MSPPVERGGSAFVGVHWITRAQNPPAAVRWEGKVYMTMARVAESLGAELHPADCNCTVGAVILRVVLPAREWSLPNGGDRVVDSASKRVTLLDHPLLVLNGRHYIEVSEAISIFGIKADANGVLRTHPDGKSVNDPIMEMASPYFCHEVSAVVEDVRGLRTTASLQARSALHGDEQPRILPLGTNLLQRRTFTFDGEPSALVNLASSPPESFLVSQRELEAASHPSDLRGTYWDRQFAWFEAEARRGDSLKHGIRGGLKASACLTVDLCWSMRRYENPLLECLRRESRDSEHPVHALLFISGRWLEQHPEEIHNLIELGQEPGLCWTWGLHSWIHPKEANFLNDVSPADLRRDTLRLEQLMLRWGLVPTVYYRFPGLVHDETRLRTLLGMGLLSIDCESWLAQRLNKEDTPFAHAIQDGSIVLVHGNGNEPIGVAAFNDWLHDHRDWTFGPISKFLPVE